MKNISKLIYLTIFLILFVACIFTIAELNIIAKQDYTNHLEQSVIMNASFFIICKLIIQSVITYISGNMLYLKYKDIAIEKDLQKSMDNISKGMSLNNIDFIKPERDDLSFVEDHFKAASDSNLLQFDPIDEVDKYDKFGIDYSNTFDIKRDRNGRIKSVDKKVAEGELLSDIIKAIKYTDHSFSKAEILLNKRWKQLNINEYDDIPANRREHVNVEGDTYWYVEVE